MHGNVSLWVVADEGGRKVKKVRRIQSIPLELRRPDTCFLPIVSSLAASRTPRALRARYLGYSLRSTDSGGWGGQGRCTSGMSGCQATTSH